MELDQEHGALQVQLAEAYTAAMAERNGSSPTCAQLARVQGNDPPALAVLEETAEVPPRHT